MAKANYVSKDAAFEIWQQFVWRFVAGLILQYFVDNYDVPCATLIDIFLYFWAWQWAVRASLKDRYAAFTFIAENKKTGQSILKSDGRVSWYVALHFWWALTWRVYFIPFVIDCFVVLGAMLSGKNLFEAWDAMYAPWVEYTSDAVMLAVSIGAMRDALADRYWRFRFKTQPKTRALQQ